MEDLIPEEEVVVTITRDGYAKRTRSDNYRAQRRGGKGVRGAQLRTDDVVEHFFVTTTHHWLLFFTNLGRVYRAKALRAARGRPRRQGSARREPAGLPARARRSRRSSTSPTTVRRRSSCSPPGQGRIKKTRLEEYDSNRAGGVIAINLGEGDELVSARLLGDGTDILLVSRKGMSLRFTADDAALRPMGRATAGRHRDALPRGRPTAVDGRRPRRGRRVRLRRHRAGLRQAHLGRGVPQPGPRRPGHQGRQADRGARRPGRRHDRR